MQVDAGGVPPARLATGSRVEAKVRSRAGVLLTTSLPVENEEGGPLFEREGWITLSTPAGSNFFVRDITVGWNAPTAFTGAGPSWTAVRRMAHVKGNLSADRDRLTAIEIELEP